MDVIKERAEGRTDVVSGERAGYVGVEAQEQGWWSKWLFVTLGWWMYWFDLDETIDQTYDGLLWT